MSNESGVFIFNASKLKAKSAMVDADNVRAFDKLAKADGYFFTLDARPYKDLLDNLSMMYTFRPVGEI